MSQIKVFQSVQIGKFKTGEDCLAAVKQSGYRVANFETYEEAEAWDIKYSDNHCSSVRDFFTNSTVEQSLYARSHSDTPTIELVRVTLRDLKIHPFENRRVLMNYIATSATLSTIIRHARKLGLVPCLPEVGPELCLALSDEYFPREEMYIVTTFDHITLRVGYGSYHGKLFQVQHNKKRKKLYCGPFITDGNWGFDHTFVFQKL